MASDHPTEGTAGRCIFCGGLNVTKEHIWSRWIASFLPATRNDERTEVMSTFVRMTEPVGRPKVTNRCGSTFTKTVRVVCAGCNNGWMNQLETLVAPILKPMMTSQPHTIHATALLTLVQWLTMKFMVAEHSQRSEAVTQASDRIDFMRRRKIPINMRIWIARCGVDGWGAAYVRHAATVSVDATPPATPAKNIHSITFGAGDLLVYASDTSVENLSVDWNVSHPGRVLLAFPNPSLSIEWPPAESLSSEQALTLSESLTNYLRKTARGWKPYPI